MAPDGHAFGEVPGLSPYAEFSRLERPAEQIEIHGQTEDFDPEGQESIESEEPVEPTPPSPEESDSDDEVLPPDPDDYRDPLDRPEDMTDSPLPQPREPEV